MNNLPPLERLRAELARVAENEAKTTSRSRPHPAWVAGAAAAVLAGVLLWLLLDGTGGGRLSLAGRAYAETSGQGIVHWQTDSAGSVNGNVAVRQRTEGWAYDGITHELHSDVIHGKAHVTAEFHGPTRQTSSVFSGGDPFAAFRRAFRNHQLRDLGQGRFEVPFRHIQKGGVVYEVDPSTGRPARLIITTPRPAMLGKPAFVSKTVMTFTTYEHLAPTAENRALLNVLPKPAQPARAASRYFRVLRDGAPATGPNAPRLRQIARQITHRDDFPTAQIRVLAPHFWLFAADKTICLASDLSYPQPHASTAPPRLGGGLGTGCSTLARALRFGLGTSFPGHATFVATPDGVTAVERRKAHRWERYPVHDGLARLPAGGYPMRLIH